MHRCSGDPEKRIKFRDLAETSPWSAPTWCPHVRGSFRLGGRNSACPKWTPKEWTGEQLEVFWPVVIRFGKELLKFPDHFRVPRQSGRELLSETVCEPF